MSATKFHEKPTEATQLLPPEAYTSRAWFEREQRELFGRSWHFAGMATDAPNPGDYMCTQSGLYPLFVVRQEDGSLKAFHNICRHRGSLIVEGRGSAEGASPERAGAHAPEPDGFTPFPDRVPIRSRSSSMNSFTSSNWR